MDRIEMLRRLRKKLLGRLERPDGPSSVAELFSLMRDLNYLHLRLFQVVAAREDLPPACITALLGVEEVDSETLLIRAKGWSGQSEGLLLEAANLLPLICLHHLPPSAVSSQSEETREREAQQDRVISLLLNEIRSLKEELNAQRRPRRADDDDGALPPRV